MLEPCSAKTQVVYFTYEPPGRFISKIRNLWFLNLLYLYTCTLFLLNSCKLLSLHRHPQQFKYNNDMKFSKLNARSKLVRHLGLGI